MAIDKPSWLRNALDYLNWDILGYQVYVGDAVESGIDWAVGKLNTVYYWADTAYDWAINAWYKAIEVGADAWRDLQAVKADLLLKVNDIWAGLSTWWNDRVDWFRELIDSSQGWLEDLIDNVDWGLDQLRGTWDSFWEDTWPDWTRYVNQIWARVDNFFTQTLPGLVTGADLNLAFNDFRLEWSDLFTFWSEFRTELGDFISEPVEWLFKKVVDWFLGPED